MGLLDNCAPSTRRDTSDYSVDMPIMDGPYGDVAAHAGPSDEARARMDDATVAACESVARQLRAIAERGADRAATLARIRADIEADANVPTRGGPYPHAS